MDYRYCSECGRLSRSEGDFCSFCGNRFTDAYIVPCASCGKSIAAGSNFCNYCGAEVVKIKESLRTFYALTKNEIKQLSGQRKTRTDQNGSDTTLRDHAKDIDRLSLLVEEQKRRTENSNKNIEMMYSLLKELEKKNNIHNEAIKKINANNASPTDNFKEIVTIINGMKQKIDKLENLVSTFNSRIRELESIPFFPVSTQDFNIVKKGKEYILIKYKGDGGDVVVPDGVTCIGVAAFANCKKLRSVVLPGGIKEIEADAFVNCSSLSKINLPFSLKKIGNTAFYSCSSLAGVEIPKNAERIGMNAFQSCTSLKSVNIPEGVRNIENGAFSQCPSLLNIHITSGTETIGTDAFRGCTSLQVVSISGDVKNIGDYSFYGCTFLNTVVIAEGVQSIGTFAFDSCPALKSITIPRSVTSVAYRAFGYEGRLRKISAFRIKCYKDTEGEKYAADNGMLSEIIG